MSGDEARMVLRMLVVAYPGMEMTEATAILWARHLARFDLDDALTAADRWILAEAWPPKIAQLVESCRSVIRARLEDQPRGLPAPRGEVSTPAFSAMKALRDKRPHMHAGPEPCPVCGGSRLVRHVGIYYDADDRAIPGPT